MMGLTKTVYALGCAWKRRALSGILQCVVLLSLFPIGCSDLVGTKSDGTADEIFTEGRIPPTFFSQAEYVPLAPFFTRGGDGLPLLSPKDVYFGYDELIYIVDERGLHVLDRAGRPANYVALTGASSVTQDRRLHVYVAARRDTLVGGRIWNLPVLYRYAGFSTGTPQIAKIIWHPFDDDSRKFTRPDPSDEFQDEAVEFTGVAVLPDNSIYVSRRGPANSVANRSIRPQNAIMAFTPTGVNTQSLPLSPTLQSLRSAVNPTAVLTSVHPPQRSSFPASGDLILAQSPRTGEVQAESQSPLRFAVLSILAVETIDGIEYRTDAAKVQVAADTSKGDGFLYEEFKFLDPVDLAFAADGSNYIFVLDAGKDSLFVFTSSGVEGVAPPPGARSTKPVVVSFGGTGDGATRFNDPQGVAYGDRIVYVADTGNNRISRFRLNTDFE